MLFGGEHSTIQWGTLNHTVGNTQPHKGEKSTTQRGKVNLIPLGGEDLNLSIT